jgi:hypothetical protein
VKETVEAYFKILSWYLPGGGIEEDHDKSQSGQSVSWLRFELEECAVSIFTVINKKT